MQRTIRGRVILSAVLSLASAGAVLAAGGSLWGPIGVSGGCGGSEGGLNSCEACLQVRLTPNPSKNYMDLCAGQDEVETPGGGGMGTMMSMAQLSASGEMSVVPSSLGLPHAAGEGGHETFTDLQHFTLGYRRYLIVPDEFTATADEAGGTQDVEPTGGEAPDRPQLSLFLEGGLGIYDAERGGSDTGYNVKFGAEVPITQQWGLEAVVGYHSVEIGTQDLDFVNLLVGLRFHVLERQ